tara:strand:- start:1451 stop:1636 length:186 start_codon:yes stop_codon:yes gene_type:complete
MRQSISVHGIKKIEVEGVEKLYEDEEDNTTHTRKIKIIDEDNNSITITCFANTSELTTTIS